MTGFAATSATDRLAMILGAAKRSSAPPASDGPSVASTLAAMAPVVGTRWAWPRPPTGSQLVHLSSELDALADCCAHTRATARCARGPPHGGTKRVSGFRNDAVTSNNTPPGEATQLAGANSTLTNPADDALNETACAAMGASGPCPQWVSTPAPQPGELWSQYETDLQNAGFTKITRETLGPTRPISTVPPPPSPT